MSSTTIPPGRLVPEMQRSLRRLSALAEKPFDVLAIFEELHSQGLAAKTVVLRLPRDGELQFRFAGDDIAAVFPEMVKSRPLKEVERTRFVSWCTSFAVLAAISSASMSKTCVDVRGRRYEIQGFFLRLGDGSEKDGFRILGIVAFPGGLPK